MTAHVCVLCGTHALLKMQANEYGTRRAVRHGTTRAVCPDAEHFRNAEVNRAYNVDNLCRELPTRVENLRLAEAGRLPK